MAKLCGVPAYYIEDRISHLLKYEAMTEPAKGKYQTDFLICADKCGLYCEENAEKALMPLMDELLAEPTTLWKPACFPTCGNMQRL